MYNPLLVLGLIWSASCVCMCVCVEGGEIKWGTVWMCACGCVHVRRGRGCMDVAVTVKG